MNGLGIPPHICLITEGKVTSENFESESALIVERAVAASSDGVNMIQIREKSLDGRLLFELTRAVVSVSGQMKVFVNDRADVAFAAGACGVHLPESSIDAAVVRRTFPSLCVGVSTHSVAAARAAFTAGADYVFFGPVFETPGKGEPVGKGILSAVCEAVGEGPVIGLGGIDESNCNSVFEEGAAGMAAIRSLNDAESRRLICERLRQRIVPE